MGQTIFVPVEGQHITQSGDGPPQPTQAQERPSWTKRSLHNVRLSRQEVAVEPVWTQNGPVPELKWQPVEQRAEPQISAPPQSQPYHAVNPMAENQYENNQYGNQQQQQGGAQPPNPQDYDFFDSNDTARFHSDNSAYYAAQVDARLQPHLGALQEAALQRDYNAAVARYGNDANFQECMKVALENCAEADKSGKPFNIVEEYQRANDASAARPGQRGSAHLPEAFRDKKRGIGMLGRIMHHNQTTGRSRR